MDQLQDGTTPQEADAPNGRVTDFFHLPREMRDQIYACLTVDIIIADQGIAPSCTIPLRIIMKNATTKRLLLVNRQFGAEYKQQVLSMQTLLIKDTGNYDEKLKEMDLSFIAHNTNATKVKMQLLSCPPEKVCYEVDSIRAFCDVEEHCEWIAEFLDGMAQIQQVEIELFVHSSAPQTLKWFLHVEVTRMEQRVGKMAKVSKVSRIEVYAFSWPDGAVDGRKGLDAYKQDRKLVTKWTKREGWQAQC